MTIYRDARNEIEEPLTDEAQQVLGAAMVGPVGVLKVPDGAAAARGSVNHLQTAGDVGAGDRAVFAEDSVLRRRKWIRSGGREKLMRGREGEVNKEEVEEEAAYGGIISEALPYLLLKSVFPLRDIIKSYFVYDCNTPGCIPRWCCPSGASTGSSCWSPCPRLLTSASPPGTRQPPTHTARSGRPCSRAAPDSICRSADSPQHWPEGDEEEEDEEGGGNIPSN